MTYMNNRSVELRALAQTERDKAAAATLPQVRDRALRAAEAWDRMADVAARTELGREQWARKPLHQSGT